VGYAIPGTVLAVGLFAPVAALNGWLQDRLDVALGATAPQLFLQGTLLTMFVAYLARFLAVGTGRSKAGSSASTATSTKRPCCSARAASPGCVGCTCRCCAAACWPRPCRIRDLMKELPITLMTRPFGSRRSQCGCSR